MSWSDRSHGYPMTQLALDFDNWPRDRPPRFWIRREHWSNGGWDIYQPGVLMDIIRSPLLCRVTQTQVWQVRVR